MPLMVPSVKETLDHINDETDRAVYLHVLEDLVRDLAYPDAYQDVDLLRARARDILERG